MKAILFCRGSFLKLCLLFSIIFDAVQAKTSTGDITPQATACAFPGKGGSGSSTRAIRRSESMSKEESNALTKRILQSPFGPDGPAGYLSPRLQVADFMPFGSVWSKTQFEDLEDEDFKSAVGTLSGCVSVAVVSRKGVFLSHHWESPAFSPSTDFSQIGSQEFFQEHVLDVIEQSGIESPSLTRYTVGDGPLSAQYHPQAFVFMRAASGHAAYDRAYTNKVEQLARLVSSIVGVTTQIQVYFNIDRDAPTDSPAGKIFFEYDPEAVACDPPKAGYRLWVEDSLAGHDTWDPLDSQKPE